VLEQSVFHIGVRIGPYPILAIRSDLHSLLGLGVVHIPCQGSECAGGRSCPYSIVG